MTDGKSLPELDEARFLRPKDELLVNAQGRPRRASIATLFASRGAVYVNDFGAIADGISHPLSESYSSLKDAQADYPAATSLLDEKDWCAWQAASNYVYARDDSPRPDNWSAGHFVADGNYVINRTITFNHVGAIVEGTFSPTRFSFKGGTSVTYRGPNGTLDDPVYIFDFYLFDESRQGQRGGANYRSGAPPMRKGNDPYSGGGTFRVKNITFRGKDGDMNANSATVSGFVSGIRIRKGSYCHVSWCHFSGTLWDGIKFTDAQLFPIIEYNNFYGVHRDAVAFDVASNFSTTHRIIKNEFAFVGRYAILCDYSGSVEAGGYIEDNDFEHSYAASFFVKHPEWFVQGVVSAVCCINDGNLSWHDNRTEGVILTEGYHAELHLVSCANPIIDGGTLHNIAVTGLSQTGNWRTPMLITYKSVTGHTDITDLRNYGLGTRGVGSFDCEGLRVINLYNMLNLLCADGHGLSSSNTHYFDAVTFHYISMAIVDRPGVNGVKMVEPAETNKPTMMLLPGNLNLRDCTITCLNSAGRRYGHYNTMTGTGDFYLRDGEAVFGAWSPNRAYKANLRSLSWTVPTSANANGRFYQCVQTGISGASEPNWTSANGVGSTLADGTVLWECVGTCPYPADANAREWTTAGLRNRVGSAPPTTGEWGEGAKIWSGNPTPGNSLGWVCVKSGTPGVWRGFGAVDL